jgi:FG-GAP repeat
MGGDQSGYSVGSAGDINNDNYPDMIIGASNADPNGHGQADESYVVFGGANIGTGGSLNLASLNGSIGSSEMSV